MYQQEFKAMRGVARQALTIRTSRGTRRIATDTEFCLMPDPAMRAEAASQVRLAVRGVNGAADFTSTPKPGVPKIYYFEKLTDADSVALDATAD